jgi:membrane protease YdiL (CAAX protease family)
VPASQARRTADLLVVAAMAFPTLGAWVYFVVLEGSPLARPIYLASKGVQFALPVLWWAMVRGGLPASGIGRGGWRRAAAGLLSGLALAAGLAVVYGGPLAGSPLAAEAAARIRQTLGDFRISGPGQYLAMAAGLAVVHSLLEEVYWRAFVFQRLAAWLPSAPAVALGSLAFASHHLIVVARYVPADRFWTLAVPATAAVGLVGAHWCALYRRTGSLLAPWASHLLVDAAVLAIGWELVRRP